MPDSSLWGFFMAIFFAEYWKICTQCGKIALYAWNWRQYMSRLGRFLDAMRARGLFAALIHGRENIRYLTGYTGEGWLFVSEGARAILTDFRYVEQVGLQAPDLECARTRTGKTVEQLVAELFKRSDADKLAVETNVMSYDEFQALSKELGGDDKLVPLSRIPEELRAV